MVKVNDQLMVMVDAKGLFGLPSGDANKDSSAQCAAHSAVWQMTGFNVEVGPRLGRLNEAVNIYQCDLSYTGFNGSEQIHPPAWSEHNIRVIRFVNPFEYNAYDWAEPDEFVNVLDAFVSEQSARKLLDPVNSNR